MTIILGLDPSLSCTGWGVIRAEGSRLSHIANGQIATQAKAPIAERLAQIQRELAAVMQEFTQRGGVRPFGVSLLLAGYDHNGPQLFQIDPSGSYFAWKASAIGKHMVNAKTFLEKRYNDDLELEDAVHTVPSQELEPCVSPIQL